MSATKKRVCLGVISLLIVVTMGAVRFVMPDHGVTDLPAPNSTTQTSPISSSINRQSNNGRVDADDESNTAFSTNSQPTSTIASQSIGKSNLYSPKKQLYNRTKIDKSNSTAVVTINDKNYPLRAYQTMVTPNDPFATQWWTTSTNLPAAWDISTGSSAVTIAIIDTGFGLNHEEFSNRWYQNAGELGTTTTEAASRLNCTDRSLPISMSCNLVDDNLDGIVDNETGTTTYQNPSKRNCTDLGRALAKDCNNVDDDANGYVDDVTGWDFMNQDASVQAGQLNPNGSGTTHGTMVSGVAAASGNNGRGIAGVSWNAKILPIQALDDDGYGDTVSVGDSIYYAVGQRVQVISVSLGTAYDDPYVRQAIQAATAAGIVVVAASGNDGCNCISYPARYPEVVSVGAMTPTGAIASFSNYGAELDIVAPGTDIRTSTWTSTNTTSAYVSGVAGTSFATPYVAGLIANMKSVRSTATPLQLIAGLTESTSKPSGMVARPLDTVFGFGAANALTTLQRMTIPKSGLLVYQFTPVQSGNFIVTGQQFESNGSYRVHYCETTPGTTPIYQLTKNSTIFYSISKIEVQKATELGYTVSRFAYACMQQDHDTYTLARLIDIFKEFRNDYTVRQ